MEERRLRKRCEKCEERTFRRLDLKGSAAGRERGSGEPGVRAAMGHSVNGEEARREMGKRGRKKVQLKGGRMQAERPSCFFSSSLTFNRIRSSVQAE